MNVVLLPLLTNLIFDDRSCEYCYEKLFDYNFMTANVWNLSTMIIDRLRSP